MASLLLFLRFLPLPAAFLKSVPDKRRNGGVLVLPLKLQGLPLQEEYRSSVSSVEVFPVFA